ncbi:M23 family metallopeptidase [Erythrobacter sp. GH1-10]|uniref:M23 family metallopeptidase n=1 Tax=Erythrobacter sp. GH1-10 TaxID=3349334 RepID=UPI0038778FDB
MNHESTSFNPKTWVSPEPLDTGSEAPAGQAETGKGGKTVWLGVGLALLIVLGALYLFWPTGTDAGEAVSAAIPDVPAESTEPAPPATATRIIQVQGMNELGASLQTMNVPLGDAYVIAEEAVAALGADAPMLVKVELGDTQTEPFVQSLVAELDNGTAVRLVRNAEGNYDRENLLETATTKVRSVEGTIEHNTFYVSAVAAGMPDSLVSEFTKIFSFDYNFQTEVGIGADFSATWEEQVTESGRIVGIPKLLTVTLETPSKSRTYYSFVPPDERETQWFNAQGTGNVRSLMQTPVDGARITSKFGYRTHPISKVQKKHRGVDFAAPTGTPIYASGDATVTFRAMAGGAGNLVKLDHGEGMETKYMHLNQFAAGLTVGQPVRQGDIIGYVGTTGGSTGPHLHYEIWIDGVDTDPLTFETSEQKSLSGDALAMFRAHRDNLVSAGEAMAAR